MRGVSGLLQAVGAMQSGKHEAQAQKMLWGLDPGSPEGDYSVEAVVRVNKDGSVSLMAMRALPCAECPDSGTDTTDNDLHGT